MPMIRVVLAGDLYDRWRLYRQQEWIGVVRADPSAAMFERLHFDMLEKSYRACLRDWPDVGLPRDEAIALFLKAGARLVKPPESVD